MEKLSSRHCFLVCILAFAAVAVLLTNRLVLRDFPNSGDEYAYLISAKIFSQGGLSVPSPPNREFFDFNHIINDGKYYGKYSFGWPFLLMLGVILGLPMLSNLIAGLLSLVVLYLIGRDFFSVNVARIAVFLMAISPFFVFHSASYFSHPSSLLVLSTFCYVYLKNLGTSGRTLWFVLGLLLGISLNIRQMETAAVGFAFFIHYLVVVKKERRPLKTEFRNLIVFSSGLFLFVGVFLTYNDLQTGNAFLMPFQKYDPGDLPGVGGGDLYSWFRALNQFLYWRGIRFNFWIPFSFLFMALGLSFKGPYPRDRICLLFAVFGCVVIGYLFYGADGGNQYGPRYWYAPSFAAFLLMGVALEEILNKYKKGFPWILVLLFLSNVAFFACMASIFHKQVNDRMAVYDRVEREGLKNAVVILSSTGIYCSGDMAALDLTRNGIHFDGPVLYVIDRGKRNEVLMKALPGRKFYSWRCEDIETEDLNPFKLKRVVRAKYEFKRIFPDPDRP